VDFFCAELGLIIEIDGSSHFNKANYDAYREKRLIALGYEVVRFNEGEVLNQFGDVVRQLIHVIDCMKVNRAV
jgi:very-short-patch-repair endonuclease